MGNKKSKKRCLHPNQKYDRINNRYYCVDCGEITNDCNW